MASVDQTGERNEEEWNNLRLRSTKLDQIQIELTNERESQINAQRRIGSLQAEFNKALAEISALKRESETKSSSISASQDDYLHMATKVKGYPQYYYSTISFEYRSYAVMLEEVVDRARTKAGNADKILSPTVRGIPDLEFLIGEIGMLRLYSTK